MSDDKYKMFKNFMHNELQITREDIQEWVKESVREEAHKVIKQSCGKFDIDAIVHNQLYKYNWYNSDAELKKDILDTALSQIITEYTVEIKKKDG